MDDSVELMRQQAQHPWLRRFKGSLNSFSHIYKFKSINVIKKFIQNSFCLTWNPFQAHIMWLIVNSTEPWCFMFECRVLKPGGVYMLVSTFALLCIVELLIYSNIFYMSPNKRVLLVDVECAQMSTYNLCILIWTFWLWPCLFVVFLIGYIWGPKSADATFEVRGISLGDKTSCYSYASRHLFLLIRCTYGNELEEERK